MVNLIINWLRGFAYIADGLIILLSLGFVEPDFSIMTDDWFIKRLEKSFKKGVSANKHLTFTK